MSDSKQVLRAEAKRHRARMDPASEDMDAAVSLFLDNIKPAADQVVAAYWPKGREFDTGPILEQLLGREITCALPIVQKDSRILKFACWDESIELKKGTFGIMEPDSESWIEPDIVIVPMLAFDRRGGRLGYGGGYYDATLKALREKKDIIAVGVAYAQQACLFSLPLEPHDERLDWIITPQDAFEF